MWYTKDMTESDVHEKCKGDIAPWEINSQTNTAAFALNQSSLSWKSGTYFLTWYTISDS